MNGSSPLRVLFVQRSLPAHVPGGLERHGEDLLLGLADAGCRVHVLTAPLPEAARARYEAAGIVVHAARCARPRRYTLGYLLGVGAAIGRLLARYPFDLIHAQEFALGCWRPATGDPPLTLWVTGTITSETPLHPDVWRELPGLRRRAWALARFGRRYAYAPCWRRALTAATRILVESRFSLNELTRIVPATVPKLRLAPLAVREPGLPPPDRDAARRALGWQGTHLLTVGRLEWQKGHALALEALASLRDLPWQYTIVGVGSEARALRRLVARLGLQARVTFAGWVDEALKRQMLAAADLFLWPERAHPAFGLAGLEAMLAGTPVVATRRGAIPELLEGERDACAIAAEGVAGFAAALAPWLRDPARLARARHGLRERTLARFDYRRWIARVLDVFEEAARRMPVRDDP